MGVDGDHLAGHLFGEVLVDVFQVGGFSAPSRAIVYDLALDFTVFQIQNGHIASPDPPSCYGERFSRPKGPVPLIPELGLADLAVIPAVSARFFPEKEPGEIFATGEASLLNSLGAGLCADKLSAGNRGLYVCMFSIFTSRL
jgi:hypothetical protein